MTLRQRTSVTDYATTFRVESSKTELGEEALVMLFYNGLKKHVIDEIYKLDRPKTLQAMVGLATRVDNRYFDHQREFNRGRYDKPKNEDPSRSAKHQKQRNDKYRKQDQEQLTPSTSFGSHEGPMDLSATQTSGKPPGRWANKTRNDKTSIKCFNCDKLGHYARECRSPKKDGWKPVPEQKKVQWAAANDKYVRMANSEDWYDDPAGGPEHEYEYPDSDLEEQHFTSDDNDDNGKARVEHDGPADDSPRGTGEAARALEVEEATVDGEESEKEGG
jgi:hypothetical protein